MWLTASMTGDRRGRSRISEQAVPGDDVSLYSFFVAPIPFLNPTIADQLSRTMKSAMIPLTSFTC